MSSVTSTQLLGGIFDTKCHHQLQHFIFTWLQTNFPVENRLLPTPSFLAVNFITRNYLPRSKLNISEIVAEKSRILKRNINLTTPVTKWRLLTLQKKFISLVFPILALLKVSRKTNMKYRRSS